MSEYQYYEFLAIDQPLSNDQVAALRRISSRARITPVSFVNEYHWGDLKASPKDMPIWFRSTASGQRIPGSPYAPDYLP